MFGEVEGVGLSVFKAFKSFGSRVWGVGVLSSSVFRVSGLVCFGPVEAFY